MIALLCSHDLMFSSSLSGAAQAAGMKLVDVSSTQRLLEKLADEEEVIVLLDLAMPEVQPSEIVPSLRAAAKPPKAILAFGPHVHEEKLRAAVEAGCEQVFTRGQMHSQAPAILRHFADL